MGTGSTIEMFFLATKMKLQNNLGVRLKNEVYSLKHLKKAEKNKTSEAGWWFQPILKNISQIGSFPQIGMKMKDIWNHHVDILDDDWDSNAEFISSMVES